MRRFFSRILARFGYYTDTFKLGGVARSPTWEHFKKEFAKTHPKICVLFGCKSTRVQLHHVKSFHSNPELEEDPTNVVWLCEGIGTRNHHLEWGHLGNFQSINDELGQWIEKRAHRPLWDGKEWY